MVATSYFYQRLFSVGIIAALGGCAESHLNSVEGIKLNYQLWKQRHQMQKLMAAAAAGIEVTSNFFPSNYVKDSELFTEHTHTTGKAGGSYYRVDMTKLNTGVPFLALDTGSTLDETQSKFKLNVQGFTKIDLKRESDTIKSLADQKREEFNCVNISREGPGSEYDRAFGKAMREEEQKILHKFAQREMGQTMDRIIYHGSPITIDSVQVQTNVTGGTATGAFFAHVDLKKDGMVDMLRELGDVWVERIMDANAAVRYYAMKALELHPHNFDDTLYSETTWSANSKGRDLLLQALVDDLITREQQWKTQHRFWPLVDINQVLNLWVGLTPRGINRNTCKTGFVAADKRKFRLLEGENCDVIPYKARRKRVDMPSPLPRSPVFTPKGVVYKRDQDWYELKTEYFEAWVWDSRETAHGAMVYPVKDGGAEQGSRVTMDSRTLFLGLERLIAEFGTVPQWPNMTPKPIIHVLAK